MSDIQLNTESTEQPVCVSEIVTDVIDMSEAQRSDEGLGELKEIKAGSSKEI